jgi:hypothetical protein
MMQVSQEIKIKNLRVYMIMILKVFFFFFFFFNLLFWFEKEAGIFSKLGGKNFLKLNLAKKLIPPTLSINLLCIS